MNGFIWELPVWTGSLQFDAVTIRFLLDIFLVSLGGSVAYYVFAVRLWRQHSE